MMTQESRFSAKETARRRPLPAGMLFLCVLVAACGFAGAQTTLYSADMSTDPGWTLTGSWAYGAGASPDPTTAHTGPDAWIGYKLGGNYESGMAEQYAVTPSFNCVGYTHVTLSFWRYLGVTKMGMSGVDGASVRVSNDNAVTSTIVWAATAAVKDTGWVFCTYDISAVADNQPNVLVGWVMGPSSSMGSKSFGWNIDDVLVAGVAAGPALSAVSVETGQSVLVTFNSTMGSAAGTASNYALSGTGQGTLAPTPDAVAFVSGRQYRLTWNSGEMHYGGDITITVSNIQDASGTPIGGPPDNTKTHAGGAVGTLPGCAVSGPETPTNAGSFDFSITFTEPVTGLTESGITVTNGAKGVLAGSGAGPYTLPVTPAVDGPVTCQVNAGAAQDAAGNGNTASNYFTAVSERSGPNPPKVSGPSTPTSSGRLTWTWVSGGGGAGIYIYDFDGAGWSAETTETSYTASSVEDGPHVIEVRERDAAGNWSNAGSATVTVDTVAPTGSIAINGGAPYALSTDAALTLLTDDGSGSGVARMRFSEDGSAWSGWESFTVGRAWTLPGGDGVKTVHVQFMDAAGNISTTGISDAITLDTAPPTGMVSINDGTEFCNTMGVTLVLKPDDGQGSGVTEMQFSDDGSTWSGWEPAAGTKVWILPGGDGVKTVHVQFRDAAEYVSSADITDDITLDTAPPTGTVVIDGGAQFCNSTSVTLAPAPEDGLGSGVTQMQFSNDGSIWSDWEAAAEAKAWTLEPGNGLKTAYVQFKDAAGNVSVETISSTITLDPNALTAQMLLTSPVETCADRVVFSVTFNSQVAPTFIPDAVSVVGLDGTVAITGADPAYTVTVTLTDPNADGTVAIHVDSSVTDQLNNHFGGQVSPVCHVYNWQQPWFTQAPSAAWKYVGDAQTFTAAANCGASGVTYRWKWNAMNPDGPTGSAWTLPSLTANNRGEYWCEASYDGAVHECGRVALRVENRIQVLLQPASADVQAQQSYTFTVAATGGYAPLTYQWRKNGVAIEDATDTSYTLTDLGGGDSGTYSVEILDANKDMVQSQEAVLTVAQNMPAADAVSLVALGTLMIMAGWRVSRMK